MSTVNFIESQRGKKVLEYERYLYYNHSKMKDTSYWVCVKRENGCRAKICLKNNEFKSSSGSHTHPPEHKRIETAKFVQELKKDVMNKGAPVPSLYKEHLTKAAINVGVAHCLPVYTAIKSTLYRARGPTSGRTPRPKKILLDDPNSAWCKTTADGKEFLLSSEMDNSLLRMLDSQTEEAEESDETPDFHSHCSCLVKGKYKGDKFYFPNLSKEMLQNKCNKLP